MSMENPTNPQFRELSYQERLNAKELAEMEAQLAGTDPAVLDEVLGSAKVFDLKAPEVQKVDVMPPAPAEPDTQPETVATEPEPQPEPTPEPIPEPPAPVEEVQDVEYWKKQAEVWKKRKADADRALTPAQQEAARLRKEEKDREDALVQLRNEIESLKQERARQEVTDSDDLIDDEFESNYPDIAPKMKAIAKMAKQRTAQAEAKAKELEERIAQIRKEEDERKAAQYSERHFAELKRMVPDLDDFVNPEKLGTPLVAWGQAQPEYIQQVIETPLAYKPQDVAHVINLFKSSTGMLTSKPAVTKKPTLGDIVTKAVSAPPSIPEVQEQEYLSDEEMNRFDELIHRHSKDAVYVDNLIKKYEATLKRNYKP